MLQLQNGQCGLCVHFGEDHAAKPELVIIRKSQKAPETMLDDCAHPKHASLHLKVTPISGCDGFAAAELGQKTDSNCRARLGIVQEAKRDD